MRNAIPRNHLNGGTMTSLSPHFVIKVGNGLGSNITGYMTKPLTFNSKSWIIIEDCGEIDAHSPNT